MRYSRTLSRPHLGLSLLTIALIVAGCDDAADRPNVTAMLRVSRQSVTATDFLIYKETQAALLKSDFVITAALRGLDAEHRENLSAELISQSLKVEFLGDSELIRVQLSLQGREPQEAAAILNSVIEAYQNEIVNKERLGKVEALSQLRKRYKTLFERIKKKTDELRDLAEQHGAIDVGQIGLLNSYRSKKLAQVHRRLLDLQLQEIALEPSEEHEKLDVVRKQIQFLQDQANELEATLLRSSTSGELQARHDDLAALRRDMATIRAEMTTLEIALDGPEPVVVIQRATIRQ